MAAHWGLPDSALALALGLAGTVGAALVLSGLLRPRQKRLPPLAPVSMLDAIRNMSAPTVIEWLQEQVPHVGEVFRLPMPLPQHFVVVGDAELARAILDEPQTLKPAFLYRDATAITRGQPSMFSALRHENGSTWHHTRKGVVSAFLPKHVVAMNVYCAECYDAWIETTLEPAAQSGTPIDVCEELLRTTVQFICSAAFRYECADAEAEALLRDLDQIMKVVFRVWAQVPFAKALWWTYPSGRACVAAIGRTTVFCEKILHSYRAMPAEAKAEAAGSIIAHIDQCAGYPSDHARASDIITFLVAGHDTTALTVAWLLSDLAHHPAEQAKLRAELRAAPAAERPKLPQLDAAIKESMRLNPVAGGGSVREPQRDFASKDGSVVVPAGCIVVLPFGLIFRQPTLCAEPLAYRPERWLPPDPVLAHGFFPFSSGRRNCIGQALAQAELHTLMPMLLTDYEWEVVTSPKAQVFLTSKPHGLALKVRRVPP
jgi:cytochrome P450